MYILKNLLIEIQMSVLYVPCERTNPFGDVGTPAPSVPIQNQNLKQTITTYFMFDLISNS